LRTGLAELRKTGYLIGLPHHLVIAADAYRVVGKSAIALTHLAEAQRLAEETHARWVLAETLRLQGDLLAISNDQIGAEASFLKAIHLAKKQGAKLFELRASMSLARLLRDQGRSADAHDLLAPIYGWFTEGFGTKDLREARALLDELAAARGRDPGAATPAQ
jgi:predicted ATPase